jgi:rhodanese-related sulfurtransferase
MRRFFALCLLALFSLTVHADVVDIDNAELERLSARGTLLIDIRTRPEWEETGIVKGSRLLTFFDESGRYDAAAWLERVKAMSKPGQPVAVICRSGNRTRTVSRFLGQQPGFATVYNVKNGIKSWIGEGRPVVPAATTIAACRADKSC